MFTTYRHGSSIVLVLKILRNYKVSTRRHYKLRRIALKKELRTNRLMAMWAFCRTSVKGICFCNILNVLVSADKEQTKHKASPFAFMCGLADSFLFFGYGLLVLKKACIYVQFLFRLLETTCLQC